MSEESAQYYNTCRACMTKAVPLQRIFENEINSVSISTMFTFTSTLHIASDDGLPDTICSSCFNSLQISYEFQQMCINSDIQMRAGLSLIASQQQSVVEEPEEFKNENRIEIKNIDVDETVPLKEEQYDEHFAMEDGSEKCAEHGAVDDDTAAVDQECDPVVKEEASSDDDRPLLRKEADKSTEKLSKVLPKRKLECEVCKKTFDKNYRLIRHMNVHNSEGRPFECDVCKVRFVHESNMKRHSIVHSEMMTEVSTRLNKKTNFQCTECPKEFSKQESLSSHMRTHRAALHNKEYSCDLCPKVFSRLNLLTRHAKCHDALRNYQCNLCERRFALNSQLIDHLNRHKGIKPHVCRICNKGFQQSCTLKDHLRTHSGETPFLCAECGKAFNNSSNLRQHLLRHTGAKPFQCPECPSRFTCKGGLKSHMTTHLAIKPYSCDQCDSKFTKPYSLNKHKRIHTGEKPYACDVCDMRFNSSDHVKRHMRTHTGEKPYRCKFCDRAFAQSNDLVKHTRSHVGEKTYECPECSSAFRLHSELRTHIQEHFKQRKLGMSGSDTNSSSHDDSIIDSPVQFRELLDFSVP